MTLHLVRVDDVVPTPWRNGGGETRSLLTWPNDDAWALRISVATVARDGPFSAYPGVQRWFSVLSGAGVVLTFDGERVAHCTVSTPPLSFDGADPPDCRLRDGPTQDLNVMVAVEAGTGQMMRAGEALSPHAFRGLYVAAPGPADADADDVAGPVSLHRGDGPAEHVPAGCLVWSADPADRAVWQIGVSDTAAASRCWWVAFDHAASPDQRSPRSS